MSGRAVGWVVSLGVLAVGLAVAAAGAARNAETRQRTADSARLLRDRSVASATHLRDQASESAGHLRDQWTQAASDVRDRWSETTEDVRGRADEWRERSTEGFERALRQAAEARDESLAGLPDEDEDQSEEEQSASGEDESAPDEDRSESDSDEDRPAPDERSTFEQGSPAAEGSGAPARSSVRRDGPGPEVEPLSTTIGEAVGPDVEQRAEDAAETDDAPGRPPRAAE